VIAPARIYTYTEIVGNFRRSLTMYTSVKRLLASFCIIMIIIAAIGLPTQRAHAATITVTSQADVGPGTLRQALGIANPGDLIRFTLSGCPCTIFVNTPLDILTNVDIQGASSPSEITIRPVSDYANKIFNVGATGTVRIANLTLTKGGDNTGQSGAIYAPTTPLVLDKLNVVSNRTYAPTGNGMGGAVYSTGGLIVTNSTFSYNYAIGTAGNAKGGALYVEGTVNMTDVSFDHNGAGANSASLPNNGTAGAVYMNTGNLTISGSSLFTANDPGGGVSSIGGAIAITTGVLTINSGTTFSYNQAGTNGGAVFVNNTAQFNITNSWFTNNTAVNLGGAIFSIPVAASSITGSKFLNNNADQGAAIHHNNSILNISTSSFENNNAVTAGVLAVAGGTVNVSQSTFNANLHSGSNPDGGVIVNGFSGTLNLTNSTVSDNIFMGIAGGAAIHNKGTATITNSTIARNTMRSGVNSVGGIYQSSGTLHLGNSIVALNTIEFTPNDIFGTFISDGHNLVYARGSSSGYVGSDLPNGTDPRIASLINNGGLTKTIALLPNSQAVDGGDNIICANAFVGNIDQRGAARPVDGDSNATSLCDIGAFELPSTPGLALSLSTGSAAIGVPVTLTHTISNPSIGNSLTGISFTNELPAHLVVADMPMVTNSCGDPGTVVAQPGSNVISVSGTGMTGASCVISVKIVGKKPGQYNIQTRALTTLQSGIGAVSNTVLLRVGLAPTVSLSLSAAKAGIGMVVTVTHTLTNPNSVMTLSNVAFDHAFDPSFTVENPVNMCGSGSASVESLSFQVSGITLNPGQSCVVRVDVVPGATGSFELGTNAITATETGTGAASNKANLIIVNPPTVNLSLAPNTIYPGGTTRFEYALTNPNTTYSLSGIAFVHTLSGSVIASPAAIVNGCSTVGSVTAPPGTGTIAVSGVGLEPGQTCKITVNITGNSVGSFPNATGTVFAGETGPGSASNSVALNVSNSNVRVNLTTAAEQIRVGGTTQFTYQITNNNAVSAILSMSQNLPPNLMVPTNSAVNSTCGGTPIFSMDTARVSLSITGLGVSGSSTCSVSFNVIGKQPGRYRTGVTGIGANVGTVVSTSNEVLLNVVSNPTISLDFAPRTASINNETRVTLRLSNPNQIGASGVSFNYNLSGLTVAPVPDTVNTCAGTLGVAGASPSVSLSGGTLNAGQTCTISFNAKASNTPGVYTNKTGALSTTESGIGATSNEVAFKVYGAPMLSNTLSSAVIKTGGITVITYTITNPNAAVTGLSGIGFVHDLPPEVKIDSTPSLGGTCGNIGTAVNAPADGTQIVVDGLAMAQAISACTLTVTLTSSITGEYRLQANNFFTLQGGTGASSSPALLRVARYDCTLGGLDTAINNGGNATFACSTPTTLSLTGAKNITQDTVIDGNGLLQINSAISRPPGIRPNARDGRIFGAIQVEPGATLRISGVTFVSNNDPTVPPMGIEGTAVLTNVTFTGNSNSGALLIYSGANVTIYNSTFASNTVVNDSTQSDGGAIYIEANTTVNIYNSTFVNNSVSSSSLSQNGGAIYVANPATLNLTNVTFSGNTANGTGQTLYVELGATVTMTNTIMANSVAGNCAGSVINGGHNLQYPDNSCGVGIPVANPLLNALASNGGHTQTMSPQALSPAIEAGDYNVCQTTLKNTDQRGYIRQTGITTCDIGAFEYGAFPPLLNIVAPSSVAVGQPFDVTVSALDTSDNVVAGYLGLIKFTSTNTNATLPTDYTFQDTDNGVHTFSVTLNQTGTFNLTVTDEQNNATTITDQVSITVLNHPGVELSFAPASISPGHQTTLRLALSNPNSSALNQVALRVDLPSDIEVAGTPAITNTCGDGSVSAAAGDDEIEVEHVTLSASENCLITVQIVGDTVGSYSMQAANIATLETDSAPDGEEVILNVGSAAPTVIFTFAPNAIKVNNTSVLTYTIQNNDPGALTNLSFTHNLPSGLVVAETPGVAVSCANPGTVSATAGSGTITVSGVGLSASQSCTIQVTGTTNLNSGVFTTSISGVTTTQTGATSASSNSDSLTVTAGKRDTVGIYRPSDQKFYLRNSNTTGPADIVVVVGGFAANANFKPVTGDWDADQIDTVGLFDTQFGVFYLSNSNATGTVNYTFVMGNPSDLPLAGRWSPDMNHDGVGVYRPSNGILYLKKDLSTGFSDYYAVMGNPSDMGIAGDFDGDGIDTVGIYRPPESRFYISNTTPTGITFADFAVLLGNATEDDPFTGDWVGQGKSGIGVFRRANGIVYLKNLMTGVFADNNLIYGISGDVPVAGRWTSGATPPPLSGIIVAPNSGGKPIENGTGD